MKFITGNKNKFKEVALLLPELEQYNIDLPEIQSLDPREVIRAKMQEAQKQINIGEEVIIEDSSIVFHEMNNLPGTFIKFFVDELGVDGIWNIVKNFKSKKATALTIIGYLDTEGNIHYFEGCIKGELVEPTVAGVGWNPIFQADGTEKSFAEMDWEERKQYSMRVLAVKQLIQFLKTKSLKN